MHSVKKHREEQMLPPPDPNRPPPPPQYYQPQYQPTPQQKPPFQVAGHAIPMTKKMRVRVGLILATFLAVATITVIGKQANRTDDTSDPGKSTEVCAFLADPANDRLTGSDIADATDMGEIGLRRYVLGHCPELAWRI